MYYIHARHRIDKNAYAYTDDKVTVITEDRLRVRQNPTNYLPNIEKEGAIHLVDEVFANAIDEVTLPGTDGSEVIITYDESTKIVSVQDDGRGIPLSKLFDLCEVLNSSAKMGTTNKAYGTSGGIHGVGLKLVNFLSAWMSVRTERDGQYIDVKYIDGDKDSKIVKKGKSKDHGTIIEWQYDNRFFKDTRITCEDILELLKKKSYVIGRGTIIFNGKKKDGTPVVKVFKNTSLKDFMSTHKINGPTVSDVYETGGDRVEFMFGYDTSASTVGHQILAYTNNIFNKNGGSHTDGMLEAIASFFRPYLFESFLSEKEKNDLKVMKAEDCRDGLVGIISVSTEKPQFIGQHKEALDVNNIRKFVMAGVRRALRAMDSAKLNKLAAIIRDNMKARVASEAGRKRVKKDVTNMFSDNRITNYTPVSKQSKANYAELFIVEGKSAKGGMESERDDETQALLSIRGKNDNIFDLTPKEALQTDLIQNLYNIFQCGIGKDFDINQCPFDRINFATDADSDGDEIACQLGTALYLFFRPLVEAGRVYRVVPPLYEIMKDGKSAFVSTTREFMTITQQNFVKKHTVYLNGEKIKKEELIDFLVTNERYVEMVHRVATQYAISDLLCEFLVANIDIGFTNDKVDKWKKVLKKRFDYLNVEPGEQHITITGMIGIEYNLFEFSPDFIEDANTLIGHHEVYGYSIDDPATSHLSLYQVLEEFQKYQPKIIRRYKGLGEMKGPDLARSMLHRDARHSLRLVVRDNKVAFEKLATQHSKKLNYRERRKEHMANAKFDLMDIDT